MPYVGNLCHSTPSQASYLLGVNVGFTLGVSSSVNSDVSTIGHAYGLEDTDPLFAIFRLLLPLFWFKSEPSLSRLKSVRDDAALDKGFPRDQNEDPDEDVESTLESSDARGRAITARGAESFLILRDEALLTADSGPLSRCVGNAGRARGFDGSAGRSWAVVVV
ncbi:hypothetical protein D9619_005551 [Psilocybe cf. subviscida]|uniref:Uncharacterized protein n=1 Tax=Psilocybe cf. subviscida TaxID=2480587 RepID=A0A8H5BX25_9AGAR|nr:hypothetical protein D9619_005551 [Psilocybe cf. subviscida]